MANKQHEILGSTALHAVEYSIIKRDLVRILILNALYLAGVVALYYFNNQSHFLDKWAENWLKF